MKRLSLFSLVLFVALTVVGQAIPEGWYPFPVDARVCSDESLGSVAFLNEGPADKRISVKDGRFVTEDGKPIRFFGSNVCYKRPFCDKDVAVLLAKRMRQLGFNVMRFHHMDYADIWNVAKTEFDKDKLDRLHWFIYQMKLNGIYVNINLHVSWEYKELDKIHRKEFKYGKGLDRFYRPFIAFQKQYAKDLLTAKNPYTGLSLAEDPCVAMVEINNENAITSLTDRDKLAIIKGQPWETELKARWIEWLKARYQGDVERLKASWLRQSGSYTGVDMLRGVETSHEGAAPGVFEVEKLSSDAFNANSFKVGAVSWAYQIHYIPLPLEDEGIYTVEFEARSDKPHRVAVGLANGDVPWFNYSTEVFNFDNEWKRYQCVLSSKKLYGNTRRRLSFNLGGTVFNNTQVRNIRMYKGIKPVQQERFANFDTMPFGAELAIPTQLQDWRTFLADLDYATSREMHEYLKKDLGVKALITDTQASYGGLRGLVRESELSDYVDMHTYWQHPNFAPGHSWSSLHWTIKNTPMVNNQYGGVLGSLSKWRAAGKPYTLSEVDFPAPNEHNQEMFPMITSFASFQDWDGLFQFSYVSPLTMKSQVGIGGYFAMAPQPGKMTMSALGALVFRRQLVSPSDSKVTITIPKTMIREAEAVAVVDPSISHLDGYPKDLLHAGRMETRFVPSGDKVIVTGDTSKGGFPWKTREITWDPEREGGGVYLVNAPGCRMANGYVGNRDIVLGDFSFRMSLAEGRTAAVALVSMDKPDVAKASSMLLALQGRVSFVGMVWNEERTTILNKWGKTPPITEFIDCTFVLPGEKRPKVTALDANGLAIGEMSVSGKPGAWTFKTSRERPTMWFRIDR